MSILIRIFWKVKTLVFVIKFGFQECFFLLFCILITVFTGFSLFSAGSLGHVDGFGYCVYANAFFEGKNVYTDSSIYVQSFRYPPLSLYFFKFLCWSNLLYVLWALPVLLFILKKIVFPSKNTFCDVFYLVLFTAGFNAMYYNLAMLNIGWYEAFFVALMVWAVFKKKFYWLPFLVACVALVKGVPLLYALLFFLLPLCLKSRVKMFFDCLVLFSCFHVLNYVLMPKLYVSWVLSVFSGSVIDNSGWVNPSLWSWCDHNLLAYVVFVSIIFFVFCEVRDRFVGVDLFCVGGLFLLLVIPELKVYTFFSVCVFLFVLCRNFVLFDWCVLLFLSCVLPIVLKCFFVSFGFVFLQFYVFYCFLACVFFVVWRFGSR